MARSKTQFTVRAQDITARVVFSRSAHALPGLTFISRSVYFAEDGRAKVGVSVARCVATRRGGEGKPAADRLARRSRRERRAA